VNIYETAGDLKMSQPEMEKMLDGMVRNGVIGHFEKGKMIRTFSKRVWLAMNKRSS
jgi:hypothetical protein